MKTTEFIKESALAVAAEAMDKESEVQLARQDCFHIAKGSIEIYHLLKGMPEVQDLDNECVSKLNMAAKYIEEALEYFNLMQGPQAESAFTTEGAEALYNSIMNEGMDFDQIRKDAEANLKSNIDKQSDARIAAMRNPPKQKGFWQSVGDKQIGMVKGAFKGAVKGLRGEAVEEGQLNEYLVTDGSNPADILGLNLFQDFDPEQGCSAQYPDFANNKQWQQVEAKYAPVVNKLKRHILALNRPLTSAEADAIDETWYDGSDAYDDVLVSALVATYNRQIEVIHALLKGNLSEDAGVTGSSSISAVVSGLGEKTGQKNLIKRQHSITNVLQPAKQIKVKGGY